MLKLLASADDRYIELRWSSVPIIHVGENLADRLRRFWSQRKDTRQRREIFLGITALRIAPNIGCRTQTVLQNGKERQRMYILLLRVPSSPEKQVSFPLGRIPLRGSDLGFLEVDRGRERVCHRKEILRPLAVRTWHQLGFR